MKQPIIIAGAPKSGTHLILDILNSAGFFTGANHLTGHDSKFFQLRNRWIFDQAGATWDNPYNFQFITDEFVELLEKPLKRHLRGQLFRSFLGDKKKAFKRAEHIDFDWAWSDPLNTFTTDVWKQIFTSPLVIQILRNPVDVAAELRQSNETFKKDLGKKVIGGVKQRRIERKLIGERLFAESLRVLDLNEGFRLWKQYVRHGLKLEENTNIKTYSIRYEDLVRDPHTEINKLFEFLEFKLPDGIINRMLPNFVGLKALNFIKDRELLGFYQLIRNQSIMAETNYHDLSK